MGVTWSRGAHLPIGKREHRVGTVELGPYVVTSLVGEGGAARVYEARHEHTGGLAAVKMYRHELLGQVELLDRFHTERLLLEQLDHPNILPCHDHGEDDDVPWFATKLCRGSLATRVLTSGAVEPAVMAGYGLELLDALGYLHERGIVHRDVKPDNILLDEHDIAVLGDFGIAIDPAFRPTQMGAVMGTPTFMPPEQLDDPRGAGPSSDLFALGSTMFVCVTMRSAMPLMVPALRAKALGTLPEELRWIIDSATSPDPAERFDAASDMADALAELL